MDVHGIANPPSPPVTPSSSRLATPPPPSLADVICRRPLKMIFLLSYLQSGAGPGRGAFLGFSGFGALKPSATSFSSIAPVKHADTSNGLTAGGATPSIPSSAPVSNSNGKKDSKSDDYYPKLRALNESVSAWIKQHVDKNPYCILTPVFRDYEKHLLTIETSKDPAGHTTG